MTVVFKMLISVAFISLFLTGCMSDKDFAEKVKKALLDNPEMITEAVSKKPKEFIMVLQKAARQSQLEEQKKMREAELKKMEEYYKNPLKPEIAKDDAIRGNKNAPITLVMYSDFQCPFCVRGVGTVNDLMAKYKGKIRYIYRHLPLVSLGHTEAPMAAEYFEAIAIQSVEKAYKFHDVLYQNQRKIRNGAKYFKKVAKKLKVNMGKLAKDLKTKRVKNKMARDRAEATKFEFRGTPGFLINGIPVFGAYPASHFVDIIERLKKSGKLKL